MDGYVSDTWPEILDPVRYGRAQNSQLLFRGGFLCLSAAVQPEINPLKPFQTSIFRTHSIDGFFAIFGGDNFIRRRNRFQQSMAYLEPSPDALPARLPWSNFNRSWL